MNVRFSLLVSYILLVISCTSITMIIVFKLTNDLIFFILYWLLLPVSASRKRFTYSVNRIETSLKGVYLKLGSMIQDHLPMDDDAFKVSSRVKNHHFYKFAIFRRLNRAHQELSFKNNSGKKCFFCASLRSWRYSVVVEWDLAAEPF